MVVRKLSATYGCELTNDVGLEGPMGDDFAGCWIIVLPCLILVDTSDRPFTENTCKIYTKKDG